MEGRHGGEAGPLPSVSGSLIQQLYLTPQASRAPSPGGRSAWETEAALLNRARRGKRTGTAWGDVLFPCLSGPSLVELW